jgi:hypothetical protein
MAHQNYSTIYNNLLDNVVDCLIISETKLDSSFKDSIFEVDGYKLQWRDRTDHGEGIDTFMRANIPARRRFDIECKTLENIVYEVTFDKTKWLIYVIYRPPSIIKYLRFIRSQNIIVKITNNHVIFYKFRTYI